MEKEEFEIIQDYITNNATLTDSEYIEFSLGKDLIFEVVEINIDEVGPKTNTLIFKCSTDSQEVTISKETSTYLSLRAIEEIEKGIKQIYF